MADEKAPAMERQLVIFNLNGQPFGIDVEAVREIVRRRDVMPVAGAPEFVDGVYDLRGVAVPVIDLRTRLSMPRGAQADSHRTVVVNVHGRDIGVVVDEVTEVVRADESSIRPVPAETTGNDAVYLDGAFISDERRVMLLDMAKVISAEEAAQLEDMITNADAAA